VTILLRYQGNLHYINAFDDYSLSDLQEIVCKETGLPLSRQCFIFKSASKGTIPPALAKEQAETKMIQLGFNDGNMVTMVDRR